MSGKDLHSIFQNKRICLLISGEGGAGKTSLACQIAKWAMAEEKAQRLCQHQMIPILIEQELQSQTLTEAISGQLQALINGVKPISEELLENLLRQRRLLVIVDHLSEMSEATRQKIQPNLAKFPVNALIVTSRLEEKEKLGGVNKTLLKPLRVEGNRLSKFMDAYLEEKGKRDRFDDEEYFDACRRLSRMVGERNITLLLARMYADQLISAQEGNSEYSLPENIPELMLCYLNKLNRTVEKPHQCKELLVHRSAQVVAWECLKQTYQPSLALREDVVKSLAASFKETEDTQAPKQKAEERLQYLEKRLRLIQTVEPGDKVRFVLDPLAEYLAALCLVEYYRDSKEKWHQFLTSVDAIPSSLEAKQGFLLAVRDCSLVKQKQLNILDFVPEELGKKAGLDPKAIQAAQRKQRVWKLIEELDAPEKEYRLTQKQWRAIALLPKVEHDLDSDPSRFKGENLPVERVSWEDAVEFCQRLSKNTGRKYRLPSEAEWEYACRAGTDTPFNFGETITWELANYRASENYADEPKGKYRKKTTPVGNFPPNAFGLYDMHGNLWEWCEDDWHENYEGAPTDGSAWISESSNNKVICSGSWFDYPYACRSACRNYYTRVDRNFNIGFRVVCVALRTT